eukprot:scaffold67692_cov52-Phaeocystis_antarctica.AAC.2
MRAPVCSAIVSLPLRTPRTPSPRPLSWPRTCVDSKEAQTSASWRSGGCSQRRSVVSSCPRLRPASAIHYSRDVA